VYRNPRVQEPARRILGGRPNVFLLDPLPYIPFVDLMARACLILTDSGGIQEEAPSLGVPVLVARETTERPEGVACGANVLVGTGTGAVLDALRRHLSRPPQGAGPRPRPNPFGDGRASGRIVKKVLQHFGLGEAPVPFEPPALTLSIQEASA
jgi:UDP-N-acetylglucosamine 2-epimerase (non-hydrolysing)